MHEAADRQAPLEPLQERILRLIGRSSAHGVFSEIAGRSADLDLGVGEELVGRDREVVGGGSLPDAAGGIVLRAVARAEPTVVVALVGERDAAEMRADA